MKKLVVVGILAVLWGGAEAVAPQIVEGRIEERAAERSRGATTVSANVDSFPLVTRALTSGRVERIEVTLDEVVRQRLSFATIRFTVTGIELDRGALLSGDAEVRDIDTGTVVAEVTADELTTVLGLAERLGLGEVAVDVRELELVVRRAGRSFAIPLPDDLFPCAPSARVSGDRILLSCTFHEIPRVLLREATGG